MKPLDEKLTFGYKLKWWWYYHTRTQKGRYGLLHFLEWLMFMATASFLLEGLVYVWKNA